MPLTGRPGADIPELFSRIKRTGKFGHMRKSMGKKKLRKAAIAAALEAERRKKRAGSRGRSRR